MKFNFEIKLQNLEEGSSWVYFDKVDDKHK